MNHKALQEVAPLTALPGGSASEDCAWNQRAFATIVPSAWTALATFPYLHMVAL
jgi:hypothetical protein